VNVAVENAQRLGGKALEEWAAVAKPDTLLAWYGKLIANKFDGSKFRQRVGRPRMDEEAERLVVQMAKENPGWGYDGIVGALANLGFLLSDQKVGNILRRHGLSPAPKRKQAISWKDFIRSHREVLVGTDFFTVEVLTLKLRCSVFHSLGESAGEHGRNDALSEPRVDGSASTKCNHGGVGIAIKRGHSEALNLERCI
jgi:hypothetical protein